MALVPAGQASALAADEYCTLGSEGLTDCVSYLVDPEPGSATLLKPEAYASMTPAQATAFRNLEADAVRATLFLYQLPASDAPYVHAWARDDVTGMLHKRILKAAQTRPAERTADENQAMSWLGERMMARARKAILQEGEEYARWAGLDVERYWAMVRDGASKAALTDFFSQTPRDMDGPTRSTSTGGYCVYRPPAGYLNDYDPSKIQSCNLPCTNGFSCEPFVPVEDFAVWGAARVRAYDEARNQRLSLDGAQMLLTSSRLGSVAWHLREDLRSRQDLARWLVETYKAEEDAMAVLADDIADAADGLSYEEAFDLPEFKLQDAVQELFQTGIDDGAEAAIKDSHMLTFFQGSVDDDVLNRTSLGVTQVLEDLGKYQARMIKLANKILLSSAGLLADTIITAVTTLIDASFFLAAQEELPGRIAGQVVYARDTKPDFRDWVVVPSALNGNLNAVRLELLDALAPNPASWPVKAAHAADPRFLVRDLDGSHGTQTSTLDLARVVADRWTPSWTRVSGRWAIGRWFDANVGPEVHSLDIQYTNHDLQPRLAWLMPHEDGHYSFFSMPPGLMGSDRSTCLVDGTCEESDELRYMDSNGLPKVARLEVPRPATGDVQVSTTAPSPGLIVKFTGGSFAPGGAQGTLTYKWRFQREGCAGITGCVTWYDGQQVPSYAPAVSGYTATKAWTNPGTYQVEVTVTDAMGRKAVKTLAVRVG
ncbi:PKD domain-containing protein [Nocardioides agariphilus]|uniref:PKD domain-containing protein n=1 Tax=Nocardioides agariphilus TaxID=433664 RepID=A0A930VLM9_9ACTN|nr:PKD domain-containing protein [Nocardioides agariphilus]